MKKRLQKMLDQRARRTAGVLNRSGFTLLELLVVVGILAALVALALPFYQDYVNQSKTTAAQADLATFRKALAAYDQLEPSVYLRTDMLGLIGKYLQDFRTTAGQLNPKGPWGSEYSISYTRGIVWCSGPNLLDETNALPGQTFGGDDIGVSYKPEFFVTSVSVLSATRLRVSYSRRLDKTLPITESNFSIAGPPNTTGVDASDNYDSNYSVTITLAAPLTPGPYTLTDGGSGIAAADTRPLAATNLNELGTDGRVRTFTY